MYTIYSRADHVIFSATNFHSVPRLSFWKVFANSIASLPFENREMHLSLPISDGIVHLSKYNSFSIWYGKPPPYLDNNAIQCSPILTPDFDALWYSVIVLTGGTWPPWPSLSPRYSSIINHSQVPNKYFENTWPFPLPMPIIIALELSFNAKTKASQLKIHISIFFIQSHPQTRDHFISYSSPGSVCDKTSSHASYSQPNTIPLNRNILWYK